MEQKTLKFDFVADVNVGGKSTIELFKGLDHEGLVADKFVSEFKYLESISQSIDIKINCQGGSVISGLSIVNTILDSKIPTTSRIVGIAASMGSVIALASDETVMTDYSLLMWHNPYSESGSGGSDQLNAFAGMLNKIYANRLGMSAEEIDSFMNGDEGKDGTWFNADKAMELGLIASIESTGVQKSLEENISVLDKTVLSEDIVNELQLIAASLNDEVIKKANESDTEQGATVVQSKIESVPKTKNNSNMSLENISASLKIKDATVEAIEAKVKDIVASNASLETKVATSNESLIEANAVISGKDVEIASVSAELETANAVKIEVEAKNEDLKAEVAVFKAEKAEAHKVTIENIVNEAADAGKITAETKVTWIGLLEASFETASTALAGLSVAGSAKVKLSDKVSAKEVTEEVVAKVEEVSAIVALPTLADLEKQIRERNSH